MEMEMEMEMEKEKEKEKVAYHLHRCGHNYPSESLLFSKTSGQ